MKQMEIFKNPEFGAIRAVEIDGEPWLVGKDVSLALGYTNPQKAIRDHVDAEDRTVNDSFTVNGTAITLIFDLFIHMKHSTNLRTTAKALAHDV